MAYQATHWAWSLDLPSTRKFVLVALADMADETYSCFPGQKRISRMVGSAESTVRRALADLEDAGLIRREQRRAADGYRTSDRYILQVGAKLTSQIDRLLEEVSHRSLSAVSPVIDDDLTAHSDRAIEQPVNTQESLDPKKAKRSTKKHPIPGDWVPSGACIEYARTNAVDVAHEAAQFRASAEANGREYVNWDQAFRTWLGNQVAWRKPTVQSGGDSWAELRQFGVAS